MNCWTKTLLDCTHFACIFHAGFKVGNENCNFEKKKNLKFKKSTTFYLSSNSRIEGVKLSVSILIMPKGE